MGDIFSVPACGKKSDSMVALSISIMKCPDSLTLRVSSGKLVAGEAETYAE
jgi:hypothetical protein